MTTPESHYEDHLVITGWGSVAFPLELATQILPHLRKVDSKYNERMKRSDYHFTENRVEVALVTGEDLTVAMVAKALEESNKEKK